MKPAVQTMNSRLRPKRVAIHPSGEVMIAAETIYEVSTQLIWSCVVESDPCMYGSATLAIVVSSACMTVAIMMQTVRTPRVVGCIVS